MQFKGLLSLLQYHSSKASILQHSAFLFYGTTLTSIHDTGKTIVLAIWTFVGKVMFLLFNMLSRLVMGFPNSSIGKESACNAGDPGLIPGSGKSAGEGIGYLLQFSWISLVAQLIKNPPAMQETWVQSLGWDDPLEKGKATHSNILS